MKVTGGRLLHPTLSFAFSMVELGGSKQQKYNTVLGTFVTDRTLTPYQLKPKLIVKDPEGNIPTGDYASSMKNVVWTLRLIDGKNVVALTKGKSATTGDYYVDTVNALTIRRNVSTVQLLSVDFHGEYYNAARRETSEFNWHKDLTTVDETETNISLELRFPSKMNFSPFKNYGKFPIEAALMNGSVPLDKDHAGYKWQTFETSNKSWRDIDAASDLWYVSGKDSLKILDETLGAEQYGLAFRAGDEELCAKIEAAVQTLVENGTYAEIAAKYPGIVNNLLFLNAK